MARSRHHGLTIIELLVVFIVVAILVGLLLPAIGNVRESARQAQCTKNQIEVATAIIGWEQQQGHYPGYQNVQGVDRLTARATVTGWVFPLLPRLGRPDLAQADTPAGTRPMVRLQVLTCPTSETLRPTLSSGPDDRSHYVVNCGLRDQTANRVDFPGDWPANGVFQSRVSQAVRASAASGAGPPEFVAHLLPPRWKTVENAARYVQRGDGLSQTLMLSENVDCRGWTEAEEQQVGFIWQASFDANSRPAPGIGDFTLVDEVLLRINESTGTRPSDAAGTADEQYRFARPSSFHRGGVVVAFCDGHTHFLAEDIDYLVYTLLMTSHGRATRQPGSYRLLREFDEPTIDGYQRQSIYALSVLDSNAY